MAGGFLRGLVKKILIIGNATIALMLIVACYGNYISEGYWLFGVLALCGFYLLILLIAFIIFWLFTKPVLMLIGALTLLAAWPALNNIIRFNSPDKYTLQKNDSTLRIMSWNVEHFDILEHKTKPEVKDEMLATIKTYDPDVACFQEMVAGEGTKHTINPLSEFREQLQMKYEHYAYINKFDFDNNHHFGIIIFSKYPIIKKEMIDPLPHNYNSIFQYADIVKGNDTFRVFNLHLQTLRFSADNRKYLDNPSFKDEMDLKKSKNVLVKLRNGLKKHKEQSDRVRAEIEKSPYPIIVCGDFNDVPNSYAYQRIGKGLKDAFIEKGSGMGRTFYGISPTLRIDYIFCDEKMKVLQYDSPRRKLSDHFPIIADITIH